MNHLSLPYSSTPFRTLKLLQQGQWNSLFNLGSGDGRHNILESPERNITGIHVFFGNNVGIAWTVFFLE
jgi:hypothetical protein